MNWIKQSVILFVFASGLLVRGSTATRFRLQPAERFEFCVARNLTELSMFNEEDKERISKIVMETSVRMHQLKADPENAGNARTMLRLFAAALACVVADSDSLVRPQREQACIRALEACAKSVNEPAGSEIVMEMKKIFLAMNREISTLDAISDNSASAEAKKKESSEKSKAEEKENYSDKESEVKERFKRANVPQFGFPSFTTVDPTLESIIADKLLRSSTFRKFFTVGLTPEDAVFFARSMLETGLSGYRYDIIQEAKNAVTTALSRLGSFAGSYDYAHAIARSIAVVLAARELTFYADGLGIGSSLVYQLDSMLGSDPSSTSELSSSFDTASVSSSGWGPSSAFSSSQTRGMTGSSSAFSSSQTKGMTGSSSAFSSSQTRGMASAQVNPSYVQPSYDIPSNPQNGRMNPSYAEPSFAVPSNPQNDRANPSYVEPSFAVPSNPQNDKTQFQNRLSHFLSQSQTISGTFCSGPFPRLFEVINSAFADYGYAISSEIAKVVSNSLNMLPTEAACTQYAEVISEVVANILDNNGLILTGDPQAITNKISALISSNIQRNPQNPSSIGEETFSGSEYPLNPSFADYSYSAPEIPDFPVDQNPESAIPSSISDTPVQQQNPVLTNSTEFSSDAVSPVIQSTNKQYFNLPTESRSNETYSSDGSPLSSDGSVARTPKQDFNLPTELSYDGSDSPAGSPLSPDGSVVANNSWVIVDYPSDVPTALEQKNQTSGTVHAVSPIILEPGPVLLDNIPSGTGSAPETKVVNTDTSTKPETIQATKVEELTAPAPLTTNAPFSTVMGTSEVITPAPQTPLKDAFESPTQLSEFLMKEVSETLKALNTTSGDEKKQPGLLGNSGSSTGVNIPKTEDSPPTSEDSKQVEKSPDSQDKSSNPEVQPSVETPPQQNGPDEFLMNPPPPITDEVTALLFAEKVSSIVSSSIGLIRSSQNFQFDELCGRLNQLAPLVNLPPLDVCSEIPLIDYLLHVMNSVTYSLAGEK